MRKLASTLALGLLLGGACASGAGPRTAPEAALPTTAPDAMEEMTATTEGRPMGEARPMDEMSPTGEMSQEERDERDVVELTADQPPDAAAVERCRGLVAEVERRDELGLFDEEDEGEVELTEEEVERYLLEPPPIDGGVLSPDERPTFPAMPDELDVTALHVDELWTAVDQCFESGIVTEDEEGLDEADMAEFCAELAGLTADDVAEWVAEEGDEVVDEEFGWCDLVRPDRQ